MKVNMEREYKKSMMRDYILFGIVLVIAVIILLLFPEKLEAVSKASWKYFIEIMLILPAVMILMGLFKVWISKKAVIKYLGKSSGFKGILLSVFFGALPTGPLYIAFPIAATLMKKGARISNIIIFLSAWACIKIPQEMVELQFLGFNFMILRLFLTILFVVIMGIFIEQIIELLDKKKIV